VGVVPDRAVPRRERAKENDENNYVLKQKKSFYIIGTWNIIGFLIPN